MEDLIRYIEQIPDSELFFLAKKLLPSLYLPFLDDITNKDDLIKIIVNVCELKNMNYLYAFVIKNFSPYQLKRLNQMTKQNYNKETWMLKIADQTLSDDVYNSVVNFFHKDTLKSISETVISYENLVGPEERFYELLDYQTSIKERMLSRLSEDIPLKRMLVHMPTGTGKTKTTMHTLVKYQNDILGEKHSMLWIAHTNTLLEQAKETYISVWKKLGYGKTDVCNFYGSNSIPSYFNKGIIFASINKLINAYQSGSDDYKKIMNSCEIIVFDEAHKCTAQATATVLNDLMRVTNEIHQRTLIGLTATPGRNLMHIKENDELALMFNKRMITIDPKIIDKFSNQNITNNEVENTDREIIKYFQERKILAVLKREEISYDIDFEDDILKKIQRNLISNQEDLSKDVIQLFAENFSRNQAIVERLIQLDLDNIPTIVFACSIEHGEFLANMLRMHHVKCEEVYGHTNDEIRRKSILNFKNGKFNILINCSVLTTGFDSTNIKCVFITRPTKSVVLYSQMIGRGLRGKMMGGNEECLLIDVKDNLQRFDNEASSFDIFKNYWG